MLEHAILKLLVGLGEAVETQQKDWHEHDRHRECHQSLHAALSVYISSRFLQE
jgi:hypothetical protein